MIEEILLLSGNDIPFFSAKINIHQPRIKEIAYIGEENFFMGCQLLNFSKDVLKEEDRISLENTDDFDILMTIISDNNAMVQLINVTMVLTLLFPEYTINFEKDGIHLKNEKDSAIINKENYEEFREILSYMFGLNEIKKQDYNPKNAAAAKIAEKLRRGKEKIAELRGDSKKIIVLSRYISILGIGLKTDMDVFFEYTVYQLYDQFKRFQLKEAFDINLKARMAGATDLEDVENWMEDIHSSLS